MWVTANTLFVLLQMFKTPMFFLSPAKNECFCFCPTRCEMTVVFGSGVCGLIYPVAFRLPCPLLHVEWADGGRVATLIALLKARDIVCGGPRVHRYEGNGKFWWWMRSLGFCVTAWTCCLSHEKAKNAISNHFLQSESNLFLKAS